MPIVQLKRESICYAVHNPGDTRSVLLIHGSGGSHQHWPEQIGTIDAPVYIPDLPGHGRSGGSSRSDVSAYADVIEELVEKLELAKVVLGGHSLGGAIAQAIALRAPAWLDGIILVGTGSRLRVLPEILDGLLSDQKGTIGLIGQMLFGPDASDDLKAFAERIALDTPVQVTHDDFSACNRFDVSERLGEIRCPTLILSGDADLLTPVKYGKFLEQGIAGSRLAVIEGAGHMMGLEKPEIFVAEIQRFLEQDIGKS